PRGELGGTYMVSSLIARRSASDYKSRLSVVYPASMCSTELRALMSSRCVSSLSSTRPGWPCPSSGFRYTGLTWIVITLLIAFATWWSALPLCVQPCVLSACATQVWLHMPVPSSQLPNRCAQACWPVLPLPCCSLVAQSSYTPTYSIGRHAA